MSARTRFSECRLARRRVIAFDCKLGAGHDGPCSPFTLPPIENYGDFMDGWACEVRGD